MSLSFKPKANSIPIAKIKGTKNVIFLLPDDDTFQIIPDSNVRECIYKCSYCGVTVSSKQQLIYHIKSRCKNTKNVRDIYPSISITQGIIQKLPLDDHEIIFITGPPKCGKTYWMNEYVKLYKKIFGGRVIIFSMHKQDPTLSKDIENYILVDVTDDLLNEKFELKDLANSLVIFDDINSSKFPKATKYLLNLMEDISCNGRHHSINLIYINQECRAGQITKKILTMFTALVIFPSSGETYQCEKLLKEYCGMNKSRLSRIMAMDTRWVMFSRPKPQYIITEKSVSILGKELYGDLVDINYQHPLI